jgi:hypothetical protein
MLPFAKLNDSGFKVEGSGMAVPGILQVYASGSKIAGEYGDPWDPRAGVNYFPFGDQILRWNAEYLYVRRSPVGALSLPTLVGGNGGVFYTSVLLNF